jgi:hypothetical protein
MSQGPDQYQVKAMRQLVQHALESGITVAQDWCAESLHIDRRNFQRYESGDRRMHPAFWELLSLKVA